MSEKDFRNPRGLSKIIEAPLHTCPIIRISVRIG
jgi:hypothetical protein